MTDLEQEIDLTELRDDNTHNSILKAAVLCCGIPSDSVTLTLKECTEVDPGIYEHPSIEEIKMFCRTLHDAICHIPDGRMVFS